PPDPDLQDAMGPRDDRVPRRAPRGPRSHYLIRLRSTAKVEGLRTRIDHHVLDERVVLEGVLRPVFAITGLLDAAVGRLGRQREVLVDPDVAELERLRDPHRLADVAGEHR